MKKRSGEFRQPTPRILRLGKHYGLSLLELILTMGIVMLAVSIMVPGIVKVRSQTRLATCVNHMRIWGQAWNEHEMSLGFYPSSGRQRGETGDPDLGFGASQPGGWAFDALAFTPQANVRSIGSGVQEPERSQARLRMHQTPIAFANCPARRPARTYPMTRTSVAANLPLCELGCGVVRGDYRANSGNIAAGDFAGNEANGTTFLLSEVRAAEVTDGISRTVSVGEKYLNPDHYRTGGSPSDDQTFYASMNREVNGYMPSSRSSNGNTAYFPRRDLRGLQLAWTFGSAHESGFNVAMCDSSVRTLSYTTDFRVLAALGGRNDGDAHDLLGRNIHGVSVLTGSKAK